VSTATVTAAAERPFQRRWLPLLAVWLALITAPAWFPLLGGYTALAGSVLVFGLAAMGLNLLLGFTGVLSFGHAAYFGLGAYGAGLTLKYVAPSPARRSPCWSGPCSAGSAARSSVC
jgi:branched-chain amino acid transport system permease protein